LFEEDEEEVSPDNSRQQREYPRHSFSTLLADLGTITKNKIELYLPGQSFTFEKITQPTSLQQRALDLAGISPVCTQ
jgi:hypothetical protein